MSSSTIPTTTWSRLTVATGLGSILCYFIAAFVPLPEVLTRLLAFAFGPLLCFSFLALYRYLAATEDGPLLQIACLSGIIAGVLVTSMLVVQVGNNMVRADLLAGAEGEDAVRSIKLAWSAVNRVQYLLDVVWDIFICTAVMLLGMVLWSRPGFGKVWGGAGFLAGLLLLVLNLHTFPEAPAYAGSVDLGPLVALWMMCVYIRIFILRNR